jgi:uncharacterized Zn-finger protein
MFLKHGCTRTITDMNTATAVDHQCCPCVNQVLVAIGQLFRLPALQNLPLPQVPHHQLTQENLNLLAYLSQVIPTQVQGQVASPSGGYPSPRASTSPLLSASSPSTNGALFNTTNARASRGRRNRTSFPRFLLAKCPHCDIYCRRDSDLRRHVNEIHLGIRHQCPIAGCGTSYPRKTKVTMHLRKKHALL